jgi:hypothetical protein
VLSILTHYKPASSQYSEEGPVSASFLDAVARRLAVREANTSAAMVSAHVGRSVA